MRISKDIDGRLPNFYGSVTVGKRGQAAIPAEARKSFRINPGTKLLVFDGPFRGTLLLVNAESVTGLIANTAAMLSHFEGILKSTSAEAGGEHVENAGGHSR